MRAYLRLCPLLPLLLLPFGCGKSYKTAPVSGRVMMDNRPLANAEVRFTPEGGQNLPFSVGVTDDQGNYELRLGSENDTPGAVPGEHRVTISIDPRKDKKTSKTMMESGGRMPNKLAELVPKQYNRESKLTCSVPPEGMKDANFDLKGK
jgi:hypothetical protein